MTETTDNRLDRSTLHVTWGMGTHVGKVRSVNEDGVIAVPGMWAVADGMGGHSAGKAASEIVIEACKNWAQEQPMSLESIPLMLDEANQEVWQRSISEGYDVMGSTVCGVALVDNGGDDALLVFNVGDSRCYQLAEGSDLIQLTTDHSYVQELIDRGEISPEDARSHPNRNVVSRAIGIDESVSPDFLTLPDKSASRLLVCSDGVSGEIEDSAIETILSEASTPADAAEALLGAVMAGPARDNVTVVVLDVVRNIEGPEGALLSTDGDTTIPRDEHERSEEVAPISERSSRTVLIDSVPDFIAREESNEAGAALVDRMPESLTVEEVETT